MRISDWSSDVCSSDLIYDSCAPTSADPLCFQPGANISRWGYYQNVSRAEAQGFEVQAAAQLIDGLSIDGNYSWTLAEDRSPGSENLGKRSEEHTSELQSLMRISYAVFCLKKKNINHNTTHK